MLFVLQVSVSVLFFANKVLILAGKKSGWLLGAIAAALAFFYFWYLGYYIVTVLEIGLIVVYGYRFLKFLSRAAADPKIENAIRLVVVAIMALQTIFTFRGLITASELASSLGLLGGMYLLSQGKMRAGWLLNCVGHLFQVYLGIHKGQQIFADFQIASAIVSIVGAMK